MSKPRARASHKQVSKGLAFALLFGTGGAAALIAPSAVYAATTGNVNGTIKDASGAPLRSVRVFLVGTGQIARTDATGQYSFVGVTPGNYQIRAELVTFVTVTQNVAVTQDQTTTLDISLTRSVITGTRVVTVLPTVRQNQTATGQVITRVEEQQKRSQPYSLYQTPGILQGEPGITIDPASGIDHIRGGDYNQTGYQIDGISITDPLSNGFNTNLVTVGLKSANYYAGGADASYGGSSGGYINTVTLNGRDIKGGETEYTFGPGYGWNYNGTNTKYGNVTPNGKFDYIVNSLQFQNGFPKQVFGLQNVKSSDVSGKVNYYAGANDTLSAYYAQGFELYLLPYADGTTPSTVKFDTGTFNAVDTGKPLGQDQQTQDYELTYLNYKHNFSPKSYANFRAFQLHQAVDVHEETLASAYIGINETLNGLQADYSNQISPVYNLRFGYAYQPSGNFENTLVGVDAGPYQSLTANGFRDRIYDNHLYKNTVYLSNHLTAPGNKLTADLGVRYESQKYDLQNTTGSIGPGLTLAALANSINPSYTAHYVDPRLGLNYSPNRNLVFRSSYAIQSQFADAARTQFAHPYFDTNAPQTANNPATQALNDASYGLNRYAAYNQLKPSHIKNFDLGVETGYLKQAGLLSGQYNVSLTGFRRIGDDDILYTRDSFVPLGGLRHYTNDGTQHSSGVEFVLRKQKRRDSDTNGFFSYTNQVSKASATFLNSYVSNFYNATAGSSTLGLGLTNAQYAALNRQETPTNYSERNTFFVLINKKINKLIEPSLSVDAGSGFPFYNGVVNPNVAGVVAGIDPQHTTVDNTLPGAAGVGGAAFGETGIVLRDKATLSPLNAEPGKTGWHYKFTLNTNFNLTERTSLFLNVDNLFGRETAEILGTSDERGNVFYDPPSASYPQGRVYYGARDFVTPVSFQIGFRQKF